MKRLCGMMILLIFCIVCLMGCSKSQKEMNAGFTPKEIIDLGTVVTEDLPERIWGKAILSASDFEKQNEFERVSWEFGEGDNQVKGSNAYYTLFNHGGPHVDAPSHIGVGKGLDSYPIDAFSGPVKVFDAREYRKGRSVPVGLFKGSVQPGDVVMIYTGYTPPQTDDAFPELSTLTPEAAEYLGNMPIKAFCTDAFSVDTSDTTTVHAPPGPARAIPVHYAFLSRAIPIYEQLFNIDKLLERADSSKMYFVGVPLNIKDGDGMNVRPVVFVY